MVNVREYYHVQYPIGASPALRKAIDDLNYYLLHISQTLARIQGLDTTPSDTPTVSEITALRLVATDENNAFGSVTDLTDWIAGTSSQITVTDDGDGTLTLSFPVSVNIVTLNVSGNATIVGRVAADSVVVGDNNNGSWKFERDGSDLILYYKTGGTYEEATRWSYIP